MILCNQDKFIFRILKKYVYSCKMYRKQIKNSMKKNEKVYKQLVIDFKMISENHKKTQEKLPNKKKTKKI